MTPRYINVDMAKEDLIKEVLSMLGDPNNTSIVWPGVTAAARMAEQLLYKLETIPSENVLELKTLREKYEELIDIRNKGGDATETYTTGYRNGHLNGQIELLQQLLNIADGTQDRDGETINTNK